MIIPLEQTLCTVEQAKQLKKLGVRQDSLWLYEVEKTKNGESHHAFMSGLYLSGIPGKGKLYAAFSVAELSLMIIDHGDGQLREVEYNTHFGYWQWHVYDANEFEEKVVSSDDFADDEDIEFETQAQACAHLLIYLLKNQIITPAALNA